MAKQMTIDDLIAESVQQTALLTAQEIYDIADQDLLKTLAEDRRIERKRVPITPKELAENMSMWANTAPDGGLLVLGMGDNGELFGCRKLSTKELNDHENLQDNCPDAQTESRRIKIVNHHGQEDFLILVWVRYNRNRVVKTSQGTVYVRRGDTKKKLTAEEIRHLAEDKNEIHFELEDYRLNYPVDFKVDEIRRFCETVRSRDRLESEYTDAEILDVKSLGRMVGKRVVPNYACALLFAKEPQRLFPGLQIRIQRFDGTIEATGSRYNQVHDYWIERRTIPNLIADAARHIETQTRTFSVLDQDGTFKPHPEYPVFVWYEAIVNACVHRSYGNGLRNIAIVVRLFDDRMEVESPGPFMPTVNPKAPRIPHTPRNPVLMRSLIYFDVVKMAGEGTRRMREEMSNANLPPPEFTQEALGHSRVLVTLRNNIITRRVWVDQDAAQVIGASLAKTLSENEKRIINFIAENGKINITQTARLFSCSWATARKRLLELVDRKLLDHHRTDLRLDGKAHFTLRVARKK
jgi:ATP-dependent DNA helicase RecG